MSLTFKKKYPEVLVQGPSGYMGIIRERGGKVYFFPVDPMISTPYFTASQLKQVRDAVIDYEEEYSLTS